MKNSGLLSMNFGLRSMNSRILLGILAWSFELLGFPGLLFGRQPLPTHPYMIDVVPTEIPLKPLKPRYIRSPRVQGTQKMQLPHLGIAVVVVLGRFLPFGCRT